MEKEIELPTFNRYFKTPLTFFETNNASIDVVYKERLQKINFVTVPYFNNIEKERKNMFNDRVNRNSRKSKVTFMMDEASPLIHITKTLYKAKKVMTKVPIIGALYQSVDLIKDLTFYLVLVINLMVFFTYRYEGEGPVDEDDNKVLGLITVERILFVFLIDRIDGNY